MANTYAPSGFGQYIGTGVTSTYEQVVAAIASTNTGPMYFGDPVTQAVSSTGIGTGYIVQGYGPVTLTVGATGIATSSAGVLTVTFSSPVATSGNLPSGWAPPVGSTLVISGSTATSASLNGVYTVSSATTTTAVVANTGLPVSTTSTASGNVQVFVPIAGIFAGCKYLSVANKQPAWRNYWPGSDANGDVTAYIINDPNAQFEVMTGNSSTAATAVGLSAIGQNIGFAYSQSGVTTTNGNTATGFSTMFADQNTLIGSLATGPTANAFLPFRVMGLKNYVVGSTSPFQSINGNDWTTPYNRIVVGFNNAMPNRPMAGI